MAKRAPKGGASAAASPADDKKRAVRIALLGASGSGKEEYAQQLAEHYGVPLLAMNALLDGAMAAETEAGLEVKRALDTGKAISDEPILTILRTHLTKQQVADGFILEGAPASLIQAEGLDARLRASGATLHGAILLNLDYDQLMERMTGRLTCRGCSALYNIYTNPPLVDFVCDQCGDRLHRRADDREETFSRRIHDFEEQMKALRAHYQRRARVVEGDFDEKATFRAIRRTAEQLLKAAARSAAAPTAASAEAA